MTDEGGFTARFRENSGRAVLGLSKLEKTSSCRLDCSPLRGLAKLSDEWVIFKCLAVSLDPHRNAFLSCESRAESARGFEAWRRIPLVAAHLPIFGRNSRSPPEPDSERKTLVPYRRRAGETTAATWRRPRRARSIQPFERSRGKWLWGLNAIGQERRQTTVVGSGSRKDGLNRNQGECERVEREAWRSVGCRRDTRSRGLRRRGVGSESRRRFHEA
jgi:hypothetical protein